MRARKLRGVFRSSIVDATSRHRFANEFETFTFYKSAATVKKKKKKNKKLRYAVPEHLDDGNGRELCTHTIFN